MVRPLDSSLTNALTSTTRKPALTLTIEDHVSHYTLYHSLVAADLWHDACLSDDNCIIRVQVTGSVGGYSSSFLVQRITDPDQDIQWASWSTLAGSSGVMSQSGGCAVSNTGGLLRAFAQRGTGGNTLWVWNSTNNGITWTGPVSVLTPPSSALLYGIGSAGNNDVFFLYAAGANVALGCSFYTGSSWSALVTWSLPPLSFGDGLAVHWDGSRYTIIYTDGYTLATCTYIPASGTWSSGVEIASETGTAIMRQSPRMAFYDGLYQLCCVEYDTGALTGTSYSYVRLRQSSDGIHWSDGTLFSQITSVYGAVPCKLTLPAMGTAGGRYYLLTLSAIYSSPLFQSTNSTQYLDVSGAILSYQRTEEIGKPARLEVLLDNASGRYTPLVTVGGSYQPIGAHATLILSEGYNTSGSSDVVKVGSYRIEEIAFLRTPRENILKLIAFDLSRNLERVARYQSTYTLQTVGYLISEVCTHAGLLALSLPTTTQMGEQIASFILPAGRSYRHALDELCSLYDLVYFLDQDEIVQVRERTTSDTVNWSYQGEIEEIAFQIRDLGADHIVVSGQPATGSSRVLTMAETFDASAFQQLGFERLLHHVDPKLTSTAQCALKASFLQAQQLRLRAAYNVTVPLNPALQLLDCLSLTDSAIPAGSGQSAIGRILVLQVLYDAQRGIARLQMQLEGR